MKAQLPDTPPALHSRCMRCSRPLTCPTSRAIGYGPTCAALAGIASPQGNLFADGSPVPTKSWPAESVRVPLARAAPGAPIPIYSGVHLVGGDTLVTVCVGGNCRPLEHVVYHSPSGMSWGYSGSGPADLARSILADYAGMPVADTYYQSFKERFVSRFDETWKLSGDDIFRWLDERMRREAV